MSSMVCHGLQSCLEPQASSGLKIVTIKSRLLKPTKCIESLSDTELGVKPKDDINLNTDQGGWSFIQALTNNNSQTAVSVQAKEEDQLLKPYVHPHYRSSSPSVLSNKSLELCTETLGSETGSDNGLDIDIFSSSDSESNNKSPTKHQSRLRRRKALGSEKASRKPLPPPLTSISGSNSYSIKPCREGGRLVMKAVVVPSSKGYFHAERHGGCLKLHYIKNSECSPYSSDSDQESQQAENKGNEAEEMIGNTKNCGGGEVELQRPSRCKEGGRGNKGLLTWEPFWVAT